MCFYLCREHFGSIHASCRETPANNRFVVAGALGALNATAGGGNKKGVAFVEGRALEDEQDILLNPELKIANRKQDARG
jgi:hypothetical protein